MMEENFFGPMISIVIDRPLGSRHPKHPDICYPVNYGYVPGILGGDGEEQDVYLLGVTKPVQAYRGVVVAVIHRQDDFEDKWVAVPEGVSLTKDEIAAQVHFQEQYFASEIEMLANRFLPYWFQGFGNALAAADDQIKHSFLSACGRSCSQSHSLQLYQKAYSFADTEEEFCSALKASFPELEILPLESGRRYEIGYRFCACELVRNCLLFTPDLCRCSQASLQYNWESICSGRKVQVERLESILQGSSQCRFEVCIHGELLSFRKKQGRE